LTPPAGRRIGSQPIGPHERYGTTAAPSDTIRRIGDVYELAATLDHLADSLLSLGQSAKARENRVEALRIMQELRHRDADVIRAKLRH
jgi:hypothetical protein